MFNGIKQNATVDYLFSSVIAKMAASREQARQGGAPKNWRIYYNEAEEAALGHEDCWRIR